MDGYLPNLMKYIRHLVSLHADGHGHLQLQTPTVDIWLHLVSLQRVDLITRAT